MNRGLSNELKAAFIDISPTHRPNLATECNITDPGWLAGFTSGDGSFLVKLRKSSSYPRRGLDAVLVFKLTQHIRDEELMKTITKYLGCGKIYKHKKAIYLSIYKLDDLNLKVLPIFERYPIQGVKSLDYLDFVKVL